MAQVNVELLDQVLTETERQNKYLTRLPKDWDFPLFSGKRAVESQRKSGYKSTAHAAREIIDNAIEAGAKNIWVCLERIGEQGREKGERKNKVVAVAFIDDGPGMIPEMIRFALSWGGGTHFDKPSFIGKFGFGLPNSSINQTRCVEVFSRTSANDPWVSVTLDLDSYSEYDKITIPEPIEAALPTFVVDSLKHRKVQLDHGTIVVWHKPDRLQPSTAEALKERLREDFGVAYRGLLDKCAIFIEETQVQKTDPLFLTPDARYYVPEAEGGAICSLDLNIPVALWRDESIGGLRLEHLDTQENAAQASAQGAHLGSIHVRVARFRPGFNAAKAKDGIYTLLDADSPKRNVISRTQKGISFVRAGREIDVHHRFPLGDSALTRGVGNWPVMNNYANFWGLEIHFTPELDDAFGVGNDKQSVSPIDDFWRVLASNRVDTYIREEQRFQAYEREKAAKERMRAEVENPDATNSAAMALQQAEEILPKLPVNEEARAEAKKTLEKVAEEMQKETRLPPAEVLSAIEEQAKAKRYRIAFDDNPHGAFMVPSFGNGLQVIATLNRAHAFYKHGYSEVLTSGNIRSRQVLDMLLLIIAKEELEAEGQRRALLKDIREHQWSRLLEASLSILDDVEHSDEDEDDGED